MSRNTRCPPSSTGMGKRLRIARLIDSKAMKERSGTAPAAAYCPDICPIRIGPPSSRGEILPNTIPFNMKSTVAPSSHVILAPSITASRGPNLTRSGSSSGAMPTRPALRTSPVTRSSTVSSEGTTRISIVIIPRTTLSTSVSPALGSTTWTISSHARMVSPLIPTTRSPCFSPAAAAGLPGTTRPTRGSQSGIIACRMLTRAPASVPGMARTMGSTPSANSKLSRSEVRSTSAAPMAPREATVSPFTRRICVPYGRLANALAAAGRTASSNRAIRVVGSSTRPYTADNPTYTAHANSAFMITPAEITMILAASGLASNSFSGGNSSSRSPPSNCSMACCSSLLAIFT